MLDGLKQRARRLKTELYALYLAYHDPRVPWYARLFAAVVVTYAFSPIDLIPDFIPVHWLPRRPDTLPIGIVLALRMIPPEVMTECRERAKDALREGRPTSWIAAGIIIGVWLLLAAFSVFLVLRLVIR